VVPAPTLKSPPTVFIVKTWKTRSTSTALLEVAGFLRSKYQAKIVLERFVIEELELDFAIPFVADAPPPVDFIITIGGDGTLLFLNSLFQGTNPIPPVLALAMGSLGFLTPYKFQNYQKCIDEVISSPWENVMTTRARLKAKVHDWRDEWHAPSKLHEYTVLNEIHISRGAGPHLTALDLYVDEELATTVQADGLVISTATGSTGYSLSAGGPMLPPTVPGILITPVSPHSLSFRHIVLPITSKIRVQVPRDARAPALWTGDGRSPMVTMERGAYVTVSHACTSFPTFNFGHPTAEWFKSIRSRFNWNIREKQKSLEWCE